MGNKMGLIQKLKICWFLLTEETRKNILTLTCEFCDSTNIIAKNKSIIYNHCEHKDYTAEYVCINCKATCVGEQHWSRISCTNKEVTHV